MRRWGWWGRRYFGTLGLGRGGEIDGFCGMGLVGWGGREMDGWIDRWWGLFYDVEVRSSADAFQIDETGFFFGCWFVKGVKLSRLQFKSIFNEQSWFKIREFMRK